MGPERPARPAALPATLSRDLRAVVGEANVLVDGALLDPFEVDWTGRFHGRCAAVVRPADTAQVAAVVGLCASAGVPVVPQGGNTGLVGGGVPRGGEVVLSLRRLRRLEPVDVRAGQVTAGAGVTLEELQAHARRAGYEVGVDFAARGSATVGGIAATNAGGERVVRYGVTRHQVVGVEAVLPDGSVVSRLSGLVKDNGGYDVTTLLVGSEGTLGVITAVRLALFPALPDRATALVGLAGTEAALAVLAAVRAAGVALEAAELLFDDGLELVRQHLGLPAPMAGRHPAYLLLEAAGHHGQLDGLVEALARAEGVVDAVVAEGTEPRERLWSYREAHTVAIASVGVPVKLDVAVPPRSLAAFEVAVRARVAAEPGVRLVLFGHLAEGNLHVNLLGAGGREERVTQAVLDLVADFGGSIAAEHGVGQAKAAWLPLCRSPEDIAVMRSIKRAIDPSGIVNPGVVFGLP